MPTIANRVAKRAANRVPAHWRHKENEHSDAFQQVKLLRETMAQPHHIARRNNTGFTLLELLVALALMGMLAAWGLPSFQALGERSAVASPISTMKIGMSGSATSTMSADCQSKTAITAAVTGVRIAATNSAGR